MPKRSNEFQKLVYVVKEHNASDATITESKFLTDSVTSSQREVDICIETVVAGHQVVVSIECRDRKRRADVSWVEEMKAKHERLSTNALVLVSRSGFTKEAERVAIAYGIETMAFSEVDESKVKSLFGETGSLWSKVLFLTPTKVVMGVGATKNLPAEKVTILPDNEIYDFEGKPIGSAKGIVELLLNSEHAVKEFGKEGDESHKSFEILWESVSDKDGHPICLQKLDPFVLQTIEYVHVTGTCNFDVSEFKLQHGMLGNVRVAWGEGSFLDDKALLVASEDDAGINKISINIKKGTTKA